MASSRGSPSGRSARWPSFAGASIRTRSSTPPISTVHVRCCNAPGSRRARRSPMPSPVGNREATAIAELFAANLAALGLQLDIQVIDFATYIDLVLRGSARGGAPKPLLLVLVTGLQRRLESPLAAGLVRGLAGGQCRAVLQRARRRLAGGGEAPAGRGALSRGAGEIQQIVTRDDPAAIYVAQAEWPTVLRRDLAGFDLNLVAPEFIDFYALRRESLASPGG